MEEEAENGDLKAEAPQLPKKYVIEWRNKWITSDAESIDDIIEAYEKSAELMKRWKAEGIKLDPDIDDVYGVDYTQFYTYDEAVALKEGFKEHTFEEEMQTLKNDSFEDWDDPVDSSTLEFSINTHISLKKIKDSIQIYVDNEPFNQCRYLLIIDPQKNKNHLEIDSIDEAESLYNNNLEIKLAPEDLGITKEQEFWAHCSNLQAWAENDYDTRLLHSNLSFPLLKKLTEVGDVKASKVFKEEIAQRFVRGYLPVMRYLFREEFLDYLTPEEFEVLLDEIDYYTLDLNQLLLNIEDYRASKYGTLFLLRLKKEFSDFLANNRMYVEVVSHKLDKSEYSPIAITLDRQYFIRGSNDGKLKVFGIFNGELVRVFGDHKGQSVSTLAISLDGKYVASSSDTFIKLWDYETGTLLHSFEGHKDSVNALAFNPEGQYLASGSSDYDMNECAIKIWDLKKGQLKTTKGSHWGSITSLSFSPNGDYLVSGAFDKTVNVWDTIKGRLITTLVGHEHAVIDVAITDDGQIISASYDETIKVWDIDTGKILREMTFCKSEDPKARFGIVSFVLTPDQEFVITGLQGPSLEDGGMLFIWRLSDGEIVQTLPIIQDFHEYYEELNHLAISNDGVFVLSASRERMVKVWMEFMEYIVFQEIIQELYE